MDGVGTCKFTRYKGSSITSLSGLAYAVDNRCTAPCAANGNGEFIFNNAGVGVWPIVVTGLWTDIEKTLTQLQDHRLVNKVPKYVLSRPAFHFRATWHNKDVRAVEIHDPGMDVFKALVSGIAGVAGARETPHLEGAADAVRTVQGTLGNLIDLQGNVRMTMSSQPKSRANSGVLRKKEVAIWINVLPWKSGLAIPGAKELSFTQVLNKARMAVRLLVEGDNSLFLCTHDAGCEVHLTAEYV